MLGEQIEESKGKRTARRILSIDPLRVEVSVESAGKLLGHDINLILTYWAQARPDGSLYGEVEGVDISSSGDQVTWKGAGVGALAADGAASFRGAIYFYSTSPTFARLNSVAGIFEFRADAQGHTHSKTWEWK